MRWTGSCRTHYIKAYGSYSFPFGLTVGTALYGRSGLPRQTNVSFNDMQIFPDNYYDTEQRLPFTFYGDLYLEYNLRIANKYTINLNTTVYNFTNTKTIQAYYDRPNYTMLRMSDDELLSNKTLKKTWKQWIDEKVTGDVYDPRYGQWTSRYGAWSWRMGARFSF
jgi:hypothetical protein